MSEHIQQQLSDNILELHLNRPDKKNALTQAMYASLAEGLEQAAINDDVRVVLIYGGSDFCSGNDLKDFLSSPPDMMDSPTGNFMRTLASFPKPVVAAVDGFAVGIGTTLLLHCDLVYCTPRTTFMLPFIKLGLVPEFGSSLLLPRWAGHPLAAELLMLGEPFDADKARQAGLINEVCDPEELIQTATTVARKLAANPQTAMLQTKALLKRSEESVHDRILAEVKIFSELLKSPEATAAMQAILNKGK